MPRLTKNKIKELGTTYKPDDSIWNEDDEKVDKLKRIIEKLPAPEKTLFLLYIEYGTFKAVGEMLGVSCVTAANAIKDIRNKIIDKLENDD